MKKIIKVGVFGGVRGNNFNNIIRMCDGEIVALCEMDEKILNKNVEEIGGGVVGYTDFDEFIKHDMDAVYLANYFDEHTEYAIRLLEKGIHVLSECISNATMAEGVALIRAAEKSSAIYMLAENYPYMQFNQEMKRVYEGGTLGKILFAEGEYNHPISPYDTDFVKNRRGHRLHWRNYLPRSYYITHSLAPLMYITGATPKRVTAFPVFAPFGEEFATCSPVGERAAIISCLNDDDSVFRVTGCAAFGAHENSYRICCTNGQMENVRGADGKVMLRYNDWQIPDGMEENNFYMPEWHGAAAELIEKAGHGGGDFFVIKDFFDAIRSNKKPIFDEYFATATASVAILSHRSLLEGGKPYDIPDFHNEEDRVKYENDTLTPFWTKGIAPTLPCCSRPDYAPTESQIKRFDEIVSAE